LANKTKTVAYVKDRIHIYNTVDMKLVRSISLNYMQSKIALSPSNDNCYLAYTDSLVNGTVSVFDTKTFVHYKAIEAHKSSVVKMAISHYGTLLATCSEKVICIRV